MLEAELIEEKELQENTNKKLNEANEELLMVRIDAEDSKAELKQEKEAHN